MATRTLKIGLSATDKHNMAQNVYDRLIDTVFEDYSSSSTYKVGDFVVYNNVLYRCTTAITTAEAWDSTKWEVATFQDLVDDVSNAVQFVNNKANVDGNYPTMTVGNADNLIATKGLTINDDPMSFGIVGGAQKSAVGDGNATLNKLVCVDVVKNQLVQNGNFGDTSWWYGSGATFSISNNVATFTATELYGGLQHGIQLQTHKYLLGCSLKSSVATDQIRLLLTDGQRNYSVPAQSNTNEQSLFVLADVSNATSSGYIKIQDNRTSDWTSVDVKNVILIDLTQRYGSNEVVNAIIGTGTSDEQIARLFAFDPEILSNLEYDTGTLVPSKTAKLLCVGVNRFNFDEFVELYPTAVSKQDNEYTIDTTKSQALYNTGVPTNILNEFGLYITFEAKNGTTGNPRIRIKFEDGSAQVITISGSSWTKYESSLYDTHGHITSVTLDWSEPGILYIRNFCIDFSNPNINGKYYPYKVNSVTLPNYEGHGILKVVDGKVVADGTELYPDGNSKKRYVYVDFSTLTWGYDSINLCYYSNRLGNVIALSTKDIICDKYVTDKTAAGSSAIFEKGITAFSDRLYVKDSSQQNNNITGHAYIKLATEEDIETSTYQSTFPVEQGGTLQFLDENDNPIAGLQGNEIFYQKNIKAFTEAFGEAIDWNPDRIERLAKLSITPEYVNISLNPSQANAYAVAQVYNATFTIVISTALTGTASGSITFQDSEIDLSSFETKPAESIYDMDGKKVSEAPTTTDCNIASFVGCSYNGIVLWSLLHSGVNKVKVHFEQAIPLDSEGNGKLDCRASLIL